MGIWLSFFLTVRRFLPGTWLENSLCRTETLFRPSSFTTECDNRDYLLEVDNSREGVARISISLVMSGSYMCGKIWKVPKVRTFWKSPASQNPPRKRTTELSRLNIEPLMNNNNLSYHLELRNAYFFFPGFWPGARYVIRCNLQVATECHAVKHHRIARAHLWKKLLFAEHWFTSSCFYTSS
jgi:hypothetical protein